MKAYHLMNNEITPETRFFDKHRVDLLYIPDKGILIGLTKESKRKGIVLSYLTLKNAHEIVHVNKAKPRIIAEFDLDEATADKIQENHESVLRKGDYSFKMFGYCARKVKSRKEFDGSTKSLIEILTSVG